MINRVAFTSLKNNLLMHTVTALTSNGTLTETSVIKLVILHTRVPISEYFYSSPISLRHAFECYTRCITDKSALLDFSTSGLSFRMTQCNRQMAMIKVTHYCDAVSYAGFIDFFTIFGFFFLGKYL